MEIVYVLPDYFGEFPKPCMNGWGSEFLTVTPNGYVLPCPAAPQSRRLRFENVRERRLREIWDDSESFQRYRGTAWMPNRAARATGASSIGAAAAAKPFC